MAISFTRPDPSSPASVSSAQFSTGRRGFDQNEVRDFLRMVAAELARLQERERYLERELRASQQSSSGTTLDEETATRLLGEEAARIISTARESAAQIRSRAEDGSARLLREATDEAQRLREEAEIEAARRRQDASSDAEAEVQMAKQQGRDMVNEARAYRERVLSELARRRELARQQIEQLIHGRDRLLQAFERSRIAAVEVMAELTPLGEPSEYVNLQPTTGPVPMMLPNVGRPEPVMEAEPETVEAAEPEVDMAATPYVARESTGEIYNVELETPDEDIAVEVEVQIIEIVEAEPEPAAAEAEAEADDAPSDTDTDTVRSLPEPDPAAHTAADDEREPAPVVSLFTGELDETRPEPSQGGTVDDLFARLRAARSEAVAEKAAARVAQAEATEAEPKDQPADFVIHGEELAPSSPSPATGAPTSTALDIDEVVVPLIVSAARKLKRVLADEQNDVLDTLRRKEPVRALDTLLPWEAEQADRYAKAVEADLIAAAVAGAEGGENGSNPAIVRPAYDAVTHEIVAPLRDRLARLIDKADGNNSELATQVRSLYREWKAHHIDDHVEDIVRLAYDRGALTVASR